MTADKNELSITRRRDREPTAECTDNVIPLALSMAGYNSFYHACDIYEGRSNYAVCQHTIDAVREDRVQLRSVCPDAINCGSCPALAMREQEKTAGRALFFEDRRAQLKASHTKNNTPSEFGFGKQRTAMAGLNPSSARVPRETFAPADKPHTKPAVEKTGFNPDIAGRNMLGDAINNMMEKNA